MCGSQDVCSCRMKWNFSDYTQLVDTGLKGIGVCALANFKKGDILGAFVGKIMPPGYEGDATYALQVHSKSSSTSETRIALLSPKDYGNWTRFINHSCEASTTFGSRTVGDRIFMTIEAVRDIAIFEEITIHYGKGYWSQDKCMCGAKNCLERQKRT
ncbi:SET domain-containing protein [Aspergillus sclerotioniger CBS 115572]|uniref:SET domain-containing protein n=1 Tax=Aspergillus sclerotioniger CBS 115572 TaxID=1450535 RepID=A0A317XD22_9EURO|nr:SET domain-containing protein [Aspergillus sclerotioniger CBS 115572]PWY96514.1 SET domain-containing protein [Aspergillus sclerotioniger CBS 115572]